MFLDILLIAAGAIVGALAGYLEGRFGLFTKRPSVSDGPPPGPPPKPRTQDGPPPAPPPQK